VSVLLSLRLRAYWPFFALLLCKEAVMLVIGGYLVRRQVRLNGAKWFGKLGTVMFYIVTTLLVFFPNMPQLLGMALLAVTTLCSLMAAILYVPEFVQYRRLLSGPGRAEESA
jgi:cardiolipin synthase